MPNYSDKGADNHRVMKMMVRRLPPIRILGNIALPFLKFDFKKGQGFFGRINYRN